MARIMTTRLCPHLAAFVILMLAFGLSSKMSDEVRRGKLVGTMTRFTYLFAFGTWLGIQFWATFIAGATMYFNMARHSFGQLQSKLFPKYFLAGSYLSVLSLTSYILMHPMDVWEGRHKIQVCGLAISLVCNMLNFMYLEPRTTELMAQRYAFEKERGFGSEIGPIPDNKLMTNEEYLKITKTFAYIHGFSSMLNLASYSSCLIHLWYLASFVEMM